MPFRKQLLSPRYTLSLALRKVEGTLPGGLLLRRRGCMRLHGTLPYSPGRRRAAGEDTRVSHGTTPLPFPELTVLLPLTGRCQVSFCKDKSSWV